MKRFAWCMLGALAALLLSCGKDHQDLPSGFAYDPPPTPTNFVVVGGEEMATIRWSYPADALASLSEFRIYEYFGEPYDMVQLIGTTADTMFVDSLLIGNYGYCYRISAVDAAGFEGYRTGTQCAFVRSAR